MHHVKNIIVKNMNPDSETCFYPFEINGTKYLMCKLPDQPFSTLHDPETKQIVGQWNNHAAHYEIYPVDKSSDTTMEQFHNDMKKLINSGVAFTFV